LQGLSAIISLALFTLLHMQCEQQGGHTPSASLQPPRDVSNVEQRLAVKSRRSTQRLALLPVEAGHKVSAKTHSACVDSGCNGVTK